MVSKLTLFPRAEESEDTALKKPTVYAGRWIFVTAVLVLTFIATGIRPAVVHAASPAPPNILFIYTDDQGPYTLGAGGNEHIHTPNLDQLAAEGARLPNAFVTSPVCSPSRAGLLTSRYQTEHGIPDWIRPENKELGIDPEYTTWAELLQNAGYSTGLVGKWHLGTSDRYHPTEHGYDYFMGFLEGGANAKDPTLEKNGEKQQFNGLTADIFTDHALQFIERNQQEPFVLSLHFRAPHTPYRPVAESDLKPYRNQMPPLVDYPNLKNPDRLRRRQRDYFAAITQVDRNVGRLLTRLDELNLRENTIVIFTSDHGYNTSHRGLWYKGNAFWVVQDPPPATEHVPRERRPNMFDTSLRVPCIIRWPGVVEPGSEIDATVTNLDWYPTLLDMAGVTLPEQVTIRGKSFAPALRGESWNGDRHLFGQYNMRHGATTRMRVLRTSDWKLVRDYKDRSRDELYHLAEDPRERNNLIDSSNDPAKSARRRLGKLMEQRMREVNDPALNE